MNEPAVRLEEQIISLFPDRETFLCQGWILKREEKYLFVYPLYYRPSEQNISEKIRKCEEIAGQCGLDCVFRIAEHTNYYLCALLSDSGYTIQRRGTMVEWNFSGDPDCAPGEKKMRVWENLSDELCPESGRGAEKLFLKRERGGKTAEHFVMENDRHVGIRKREVLFLQGAESRKEPAPADILRFSVKNGIARILADLPAEERTAEEYERAGFRRVYDYCIYRKPEEAENRPVS